MKDALCAETNQKPIFQFLFFELWLIPFTIFGDKPLCTFFSKCVTDKKKNKSLKVAKFT